MSSPVGSQETSTTDFIEFENDDDDLNFWDKNGYQKVIKRIDYGAKACDTLAKMLLERAELEQKRAKELTQWAERWEQKIEAMPGDSSTSLMRAWTESIKATHHLADSHAAIKKQVVGDGTKGTTGLKGEVEAHRKDHYTTGMLGKFKAKAAAEKALKAAQAPFNEKRAKVEKRTHQLEAKKQAVADAMHISKGVSKAEKEQAKTEGKLADDIDAMFKAKPTYENAMHTEFEKLQQAEALRIEFFKSILIKYHVITDTGEKMAAEAAKSLASLHAISASADIERFAKLSGTGQPIMMPDTQGDFTFPAKFRDGVSKAQAPAKQFRGSEA